MRAFSVLALSVLVLSGCGATDPGTNPVPKLTTLSVTMGSQPVDDVRLNLQPVGAGLPAVVEIKNGRGEFEVTPGEYTYFVAAGKTDASFSKVPEKYREGAMDRTVKIQGGEQLEFKLD